MGNPNGAKPIVDRVMYRSLILRRMIEAIRRWGSPYGLRTILATAIMRPIGRSVRRFRQIGGYPAWIQDAVYPSCSCKSMTFIGQLDWEQIEEYGEGIYYMFLCADCQVTATLFQQT